jgi:hypothetical protein
MKSEVIAPVMLIMPELQDLCGESSPPLSMVHVEVVPLGPSVVASMEPSRRLLLLTLRLSLQKSFETFSAV